VFSESVVRVSVDPEVALFVAQTPGPASRTLLVIHGGPDWDHSYLRSPLAELAGRHRLVLPDLRGCGRSTRGLADDQYHPDAVVADLLALLDALRLAEVDVLGFSYGGLIAQRLAVAAPDRVRRLIIASSSVLPVDEADFGTWPERDRRLTAEAKAWADSSLSGPDLTRALAVAGAPANVWRRAALPGYLRLLDEVRFSGEWLRPWQAGVLASPRFPDPVERLADLDAPILLLHGRQDTRFPVTLVDRTVELIPSACGVVIEDAGHMTHVDQPTRWLAAVADFLAL
jgi:pimeloyl-ACP methyl ester carboxylesterase